MIKVAINGFGRIGRSILRSGIKDKDIEFVAINDLTDPKTLAHLLKYDSVYKKFDGKIDFDQNNLIINGKKIKVFSEKDPEKLPWSDLDIDVVVESTGVFRTKKEAEKHIKAGSKKVLLSAPAKGDEEVKTIVKGVNDQDYNKSEDNIISNASCTTNCLAPMIKVLNDNFNIESGFITTVHSYTGDQNLVDGPHKDLRRARAAAQNIIPTTTGAANSIELIIPELTGKLDGIAIRVPTLDGSITDATILLKEKTSVEEINQLFEKASQNELINIMEYTQDEIVSSDIIENPHSVIIDSLLTKVNGNLIKIAGWYDNEWGYACRMIDIIKIMK